MLKDHFSGCYGCFSQINGKNEEQCGWNERDGRKSEKEGEWEKDIRRRVRERRLELISQGGTKRSRKLLHPLEPPLTHRHTPVRTHLHVRTLLILHDTHKAYLTHNSAAQSLSFSPWSNIHWNQWRSHLKIVLCWVYPPVSVAKLALCKILLHFKKQHEVEIMKNTCVCMRTIYYSDIDLLRGKSSEVTVLHLPLDSITGFWFMISQHDKSYIGVNFCLKLH